VKVSDHQSVIN